MNEIEDLQKSVEDSLARGFYILACNPKDKSPMARYSPHAVNSATNDPETACRPYADGVPANYGVACGQSNLTVADFDHGFKTLEDYEAWRQEWNIPETFTVVSGRDKGDLGIHAYYSGETTSTTFERGDVKGDLKSKGGYVVGPGSIHPSGKKYYIYKDVPIVPLPGVFKLFSEKKYQILPPPVPRSTGLVIKEGVDWSPELIEVFLDAMGLAYDKREWGEGMWKFILKDGCVFDDHEHTATTEAAVLLTDNEGPRFRCQHATCSGGYGTPPRTWTNFRLRAEQLSGKSFNFKTRLCEISTTPTVLAEHIDLVAKLPDSPYPFEAWKDTVYAEYADLAVQGNYIPKEFFVESLKTVVGAIVADRLFSDVEGGNARFYTVLIGESQSGKGTSINRTQKLFEARNEGLTLKAARLWRLKNGDNRGAKTTGCQIILPSSEPGLCNAIQRDPYILISSEEFESFFNQLKIPGSGINLAAVYRSLKDSTIFTPSQSRDRNTSSSNAYLSILGGATPDIWEEAFVGAKQSGTGLYNRFNIIGNDNQKIVAILPEVDFTPVIKKLEMKLNELEALAVNVKVSLEASNLLNDWYAEKNMTSMSSEVKGRINIAAIQNAIHLVWLLDNTGLPEHIDQPAKPKILTVNEEVMQRAITLAEYQLFMRQKYAPIEGNNDYASMENKIVRNMKVYKNIKLRDLKKKVHTERFGLQIFNSALNNHIQSGDMKLVIKDNLQKFSKNATVIAVWCGEEE